MPPLLYGNQFGIDRMRQEYSRRRGLTPQVALRRMEDAYANVLTRPGSGIGASDIEAARNRTSNVGFAPDVGPAYFANQFRFGGGFPSFSQPAPVEAGPEQDQVPPGYVMKNLENEPAQSNSLQRWQGEAEDEGESSVDRYYNRKFARAGQAGSKNAANREYYRMQRRITPGAGNIPGYGTPARPPIGMGTTPARGYAAVEFMNSPNAWQPY